ncbi:DoxX family protein [Sneathiella marina]|uniref:DoxX family protein n=1 Tax=Sneathiella marina TaxID=2950108 RepID=A0ABY4W5S8_9PROT|nr:DoxX family protein [Sneathiella marina]USG62555.1 DoxX family protein [Sneathiella marina]
MAKLMSTVSNVYAAVFGPLETMLQNWLPGLAARLIFSSVLLAFFWQSALTKIGDSIFSPSVGAYAQIFPKALEAAEYDTDQLSSLHTVIVFAATYAEFILPALILVGLATRLASIGMAVMIIIMSIVDIFGHNIDAKTIGQLFDRVQDSVIMDQRLLWMFPLIYLVVKGPGLISLDQIFVSVFGQSRDQRMSMSN